MTASTVDESFDWLADLLTSLYVRVDDALPKRKQGRPPLVTDAELICLAIAQVLLRCASEARFHRLWLTRLRPLFPTRIDLSQYNRRVRGLAAQILLVLNLLVDDAGARERTYRLLDSTPVPCGKSRTTALRSALRGQANYGYCASHSRFYWGFRLFLHCTSDGWPIGFELADPKTGERVIGLEVLAQNDQRGHLTFLDDGFKGRDFELGSAAGGATLCFKQARRDPVHAGFRLRIESVFWTLKDQLSLEAHGGRTDLGVITRILQRLAALAAGLWHNQNIGRPGRSLIAYDH